MNTDGTEGRHKCPMGHLPVVFAVVSSEKTIFHAMPNFLQPSRYGFAEPTFITKLIEQCHRCHEISLSTYERQLEDGS
jgi:hypothetical protein